MKSMVVYSSKTGNTKKVAEAVYEVLPKPKEFYKVEDAPLPDDYDFIALGFWINKGTADANTQEYMKKIQKKKVGLFGTLGAFPDSSHAKRCISRVKDLMSVNDILDVFLCQGKVDPAILQRRQEKGKNNSGHAMTPEKIARFEEGMKHPDEKDLFNVQKVFSAILKKLNRKENKNK